MAYKQPSSGAPFKQMGSSPAKQSIDFWNQTPEKKIDHVKRTTDKIHSTEKKIGELKESRAKDIKKVKGKLWRYLRKLLEQMKKSGTKIPYSSIKKALKTSIKAAGKTAKFVPGVAGLVLGATETAKADQPTKGKGKVEYPGGKIDFTSEK
jgi:predicted RNA-binding protein Jag